MIRSRIATLVTACALIGALALSVAAPARAEDTKVFNKTTTPVWITLYSDVKAFGWAIVQACRPAMVHPGGWFTCHRQTIYDNGPWKLRFEVDANGRRYDESTVYWFDGHQKRYTNDGNSNFYVCSDTRGYYWTYSPNCARL
jgi:hypothetical protein